MMIRVRDVKTYVSSMNNNDNFYIYNVLEYVQREIA